MAKRLISREGEPSTYKKAKINDENEEECKNDLVEENKPCLLDLSDDVLLIIISKLHPVDLRALSRTNQLMNTICRDRTLWSDVDFRPIPLLASDLRKFVEYFLPTTKSIKSCGPSVSESNDGEYTMTPELLRAISKRVGSSLKTLILENQRIDSSKLLLKYFPGTLEYLALTNSAFENFALDRSYFFKLDSALPNLKVLDLTGCQWFQPHSLLALSKSTSLKELRLARCTCMEDCVPYASLAASFGFQSLEVLDLRMTYVNDSDVSCFNRVETLKKLYLEAPEIEGGENKISDVGITAFGGDRLHAMHAAERQALGVILIGNPRSVESSLTTLTVCNYRAITDISLKHAASCLPNLRFLDIRGTSCTELAIRGFNHKRPEVTLVSDFLPANR